jgi:hypothetical protein
MIDTLESKDALNEWNMNLIYSVWTFQNPNYKYNYLLNPFKD